MGVARSILPPTLSSSWYLVILCTGFSRYESRLSLWSSFRWHSCKQGLLRQCSVTWARGAQRGARTHLEEGTVGALAPQALGARLVLAVLLVHLELLHLRAQGLGKCLAREWVSLGGRCVPARWGRARNVSVGGRWGPGSSPPSRGEACGGGAGGQGIPLGGSGPRSGVGQGFLGGWHRLSILPVSTESLRQGCRGTDSSKDGPRHC